MTHTLSLDPRTASPAVRLRRSGLSVARFVLHYGEMVLAMYVGMLAYMLVRRNHHGHAATHVSPHPKRRFHIRPSLIALAYFAAVVLVPLGVGVFHIGSKLTSQPEAEQPPSLASALPALPVPDPNKKIAVVLSSGHGAEITDTLPPFEILADSGAFNVYSVALRLRHGARAGSRARPNWTRQQRQAAGDHDMVSRHGPPADGGHLPEGPGQ